MFYGTSEQREKAVQERAEAYRAAADLFPIVRKTAEEFDGKMFNCRFEKALQEKYRRIFVTRRYEYIEITAYPGTKGNTLITLVHLNQSDLIDGKRVPGKLIIERAREKREELLKAAAKMEHDAADAEEKRRQLDYLKNQIDSIRDSICYEIQDLYGLCYRVHTR